MRGTLWEIEVERRGGVQARQYRAGSLKPFQDLQDTNELSGPASAPLLSRSIPHRARQGCDGVFRYTLSVAVALLSLTLTGR